MTAPTSGTRRRRLRGAAAAVLLLALTTTACSAGRTAVGPVRYAGEVGKPTAHDEEGGGVHLAIQVSSPSVSGCHRMGKAATVVENLTLIDMRLYELPDCRGKFTYLATTFSDRRAPTARPWRSYSFVH
ncbi:hypothetical protein ACM614_21250 [Streptomyces sp. 12297]|uniref:hypothetical protein n=1 Tax=Streptomyces sp. NBC_00239 TaxID=2903640 RepID=UPI002E2925CC|nr:hypothetical protein [Streptomyces sp. NBC_00239]